MATMMPRAGAAPILPCRDELPGNYSDGSAVKNVIQNRRGAHTGKKLYVQAGQRLETL